MTTPVRTSDGGERPYGYGLQFRESRGRRLVGHGGGINGFACQVEFDPETRAVAVVLCNTDSPKAKPAYLTLRLLALAAGTPIQDPVAIAVDPAAFDALAGTYQLEPGHELKLWREGNHCFAQATGQKAAEIFPENALRYFLTVVEATLDFEKGPDGRVTQLILTQGGRKMRAKRVK